MSQSKKSGIPDDKSQRKSSNINVIQANISTSEVPLDPEAIEKFMKEEESLEAAMKREQLGMNQ